MERYSRQSILSQIGIDGQKKISTARVAIIGVGALGSVSAQLCARAGIGFLRLIDRDVVEPSNLQRQVLFTETDGREGLAKASAAKKQLELINSEIQIEAVIEDLHAENISGLLQDIDVILDGTDNFETRYLLNDYAVKNKIPFIYGGAIETRGMVYTVLADGRPCLKCLFPESAGTHETQTCDRSGILASAAHMTASMQFTQLLQVLTGSEVSAELFNFDIWRGEFKQVKAEAIMSTRCSACGEGVFPHLDIQAGVQTLKLCGRNAVQIQSAAGHGLDWEKLKGRWKGETSVQVSADFARVKVPDYELTLFKSGRVIVKGTEDAAVAKSVYSRWIGN